MFQSNISQEYAESAEVKAAGIVCLSDLRALL
jgi:hypothetical protein